LFPSLVQLELVLIVEVPEVLMRLDCSLQIVNDWIFSKIKLKVSLLLVDSLQLLSKILESSLNTLDLL